MTDEEHAMIKRLDSWLFVPPIAGQPSRAEQLDQFLSGLRAGKFTARAFLYLCSAIVGVILAYNAIKGLFQ